MKQILVNVLHKLECNIFLFSNVTFLSLDMLHENGHADMDMNAYKQI